MRSSSRAIGLFFFSAIATSIFIVFNLSGITHFNWAYILLPMWLPLLLTMAYYYVFVRQVFSKKKDYSDDTFDDEPPYKIEKRICILNEVNYQDTFSNRLTDIINSIDAYATTTYRVDSRGYLIAIVEYEIKVAKK